VADSGLTTITNVSDTKVSTSAGLKVDTDPANAWR
jgi:hypothetical protein